MDEFDSIIQWLYVTETKIKLDLKRSDKYTKWKYFKNKILASDGGIIFYVEGVILYLFACILIK